MKTNNKINAYILRGSTIALLFSCVIVALCSAINLPQHPPKALPPQGNAAFGANAYQSRSLSFAERVAYQTAIEDVYWRHRLWPNIKAGPKPPLNAVMSQADIEKKVTDYLRNSQALGDYWQQPISADQLQTEMERMARDTKQPELLRELFEALGSDSFVIAECLARPVLTERLIADVSAQHQTGRLESLRTAETQMPSKVAAIDSTPKVFGVQVNRPYQLPLIRSPSGVCIDDTWRATSTNSAPTARDQHTAVWTGSEMIVWGGFPGLDTGARYDPATDSWTATTTSNAPSGRYGHTAVWTGSEMIVWGSFSGLNTGGRYNPTTDTWIPTTLTNAPSGRGNHTAVWTGSEMIVWGGGEQTNTGGRYDPITDSWIATCTTNAPEGRYWHTAVWTGSGMIVWGGWNGSFFINTGGRYDPGTDCWTATTIINAPAPRGYIYCEEQGAVWDDLDNLMIVWGGSDGGSGFNTGGRYNPITDSWTETSTTNAPVGRTQHGTVWTGSEMIVWGGMGPLDTGGRYNPSTDSWTATSTTDAPSGRRLHTAVWTDSEMIVWGGQRLGTPLSTGGRYCASAPSPTPTPTSSPSPTATTTPTATATTTATPTATATATPTATATSTPTPTATATATPSATARPSPTSRPRPTPAPRP